MKKFRIALGTLALVVAISSAFAFRTKNFPDQLYRFISTNNCQLIDCTTDITHSLSGQSCPATVYANQTDCKNQSNPVTAFVTDTQ